jgi:hypothetical protein
MIDQPTNNLYSSLDHFIQELTDPDSIWRDIRFAEMSGCDYVFVPHYLFDAFDQLYPLQEFLMNFETISNIKATRAKLIGYTHYEENLFHYEKILINWAGEIALSWHKEHVSTPTQVDFLDMLFTHSSSLLA